MFRTVYDRLFNRYWHPYVAVGIAGLLAAFYFGLTGTVWAVTGEFTRWGGHLLEWFNVDISDWSYLNMVGMDGTTFGRTDGWIVWGMLAGALITVLLGNNFKVRIPQQKRRLMQGLLGGFIAGFGARLALGCNLAAFFTGIPQFSFHAWIFMFTTGLGTYIGAKIVRTPFWRGKPNLKRLSRPVRPSSQKTKRPIQPVLGIVAAIGFAAIIVYFLLNGRPLLALAALFGAGFGLLIERGQVCFTSAFRDLWISGRAVMTKALAVGMIISVIITFFFIQNGMPAIIQISAPSTFVGGLLFGIGIVLAGGCETGWMYRAMEGQLHFWVVGVGNITGATFLAYAWDHLGIYNVLVAGWRPVNLIEAWGPLGALYGTLTLLVLWLLFSHWWQKNYRFNRGIQMSDKKYVPQKPTVQ